MGVVPRTPGAVVPSSCLPPVSPFGPPLLAPCWLPALLGQNGENTATINSACGPPHPPHPLPGHECDHPLLAPAQDPLPVQRHPPPCPPRSASAGSYPTSSLRGRTCPACSTLC